MGISIHFFFILNFFIFRSSLRSFDDDSQTPLPIIIKPTTSQTTRTIATRQDSALSTAAGTLDYDCKFFYTSNLIFKISLNLL